MHSQSYEAKTWYRFLRVSFYVFAAWLVIFIFLEAQTEANRTSYVVDEEKMYETIGSIGRLRDAYLPDEWSAKYPLPENLSNRDLGKFIYEHKDENTFFSAYSDQEKQYKHEDNYSASEKLGIYLKYLGTTLIGLYILRLLGVYVVKGRKNDHFL